MEPEQSVYPCICLLIFDLVNTTQSTFDFCYINTTINSKPVYSGSSGSLVWNSNGYWDFSGYTSSNGTKFISNDFDYIPNTNWEGVGLNTNDYVVVSQTGNCSNVLTNFVYLTAQGFDADCDASTGSILATALGGGGSWEYSINNGSTFQPTGLFTLLNKGTYTVIAKDINGNIVSEIVVVGGQDINQFSLQSQSQSTVKTSPIGDMQYYETTIIYDTSFIPAGETITFNYVVEFNLNYVEPGSASFDVINTNMYIFKNGSSQGIPTEIVNQPLTSGPPSICDPSYYIYEGYIEFETGQIVLDSNDSFEVKFVYGINTKTTGVFDSVTQCFTEANVNINSYVTEVEYSCDCCQLTNTTVATSIKQIYQP